MVTVWDVVAYRSFNGKPQAPVCEMVAVWDAVACGAPLDDSGRRRCSGRASAQ